MSKGISSSRIYLQLAIYLFGFILLIGLQFGFTHLTKELKKSVENEYARLKIGDIIISDIRYIETNIYKMVTSQGLNRQQLIQKKLNRKIVDINGALNVLSDGGEVIRIKNLNLINQHDVEQIISFNPENQEKQYILEIIELRPRINHVQDVIDNMLALIIKRDHFIFQDDKDQYRKLSNKIKHKLQSVSPMMNRMIENANRLFFEGQNRLEIIEKSILEREQFYTILQLSFSLIIIIIVSFLSFIILRQVQNSNEKVNKLAEELNFQIFALNQHAIVSSADVLGNITYVNERFCEISGFSKEELIGNNHRIVKSNEHSKAVFVDMWETISSGNVWQGEIKNKTKSGGFYWVSASIVPFLDEGGEPFKYISIRTDITKRKAMEQQIKKSHRFLQGLTDAMGEGVYALDTHGDCIFINPETENLTGWSREELIGNNIHNIIHFQTHEGKHVAAEDCPANKSIEQGKIYYSEDEHFTNKKGELFPVSIKSVPLYEEDHIIGSVAIFHDVSERKKNEKELVDAKIQAEQANKEKSNFLANMSHEIRTPMNAIIGMSYLALQTNLNPKQKNYINKVHYSAESLLRIINDILDFSKIEAGKLEIETVHFELSSVLENIEILLQEKINKGSLKLIFKTDSNIPDNLKGDPLRLSQILINLGNNAIKFTEQGSVIIRSVLEQANDPQYIRIHFTIEDTGIGINKQQQEKLFKSFSQADSSTTRKYGGTGLGLSISKNLAQLLGGDIWVESTPDVGSNFHFTVQFKQSNEQSKYQKNVVSEEYENSVKLLEGKDILLVEDNLLNQELAADLLKKNNIHVTIANNGLEAIELLEMHDFDCVLMDIQMPVLDGYEATRRIRKNLKFKNLPIIAMTASTMSGDHEKVINAGLNDYISKPINIRQMFITINKWVNKDTTINARMDYLEKDASEIISEDEITFDYISALHRLGDDEEVYSQILKTFLTEHVNDLDKINTILIENNFDDAKRMVHTLKGVSGNIGAYTLQQEMLLLETCISQNEQNNPLDICTEHLNKAHSDLIQTVKLINHFLNKAKEGEKTPDICNKDKLTDDNLLTSLKELQILLSDYDSKSGQFVNDLLHHGIANAYIEPINTLKDLIEQYDFESADEIISKMIKTFNQK